LIHGFNTASGKHCCNSGQPNVTGTELEGFQYRKR